MHGTELSDAKLGETAIVLGCGCIGLCTIMSLKARGVTEIYAADVLDKRLEKALEVGATRVFNSTRESIEEFAKHFRAVELIRFMNALEIESRHYRPAD